VAELKAYVAAKKEPADPWYLKIVAFLCGELDEPAFLAAATAETPKQTRERRCEACFYAGTMRLLRGDREEALRLFRECVDTQVHDYIEYETSSIELTKLR
jgi:lipoprotein NlpI